MGKTKTLDARKRSSANTPKRTLRIKKGKKVFRHEAYKSTTDENLIAKAFWECLKNNDPESAAEVIAIHINALNKLKLSKDEEIPRSTIYHILKNKNPTLKTVAKLIHCFA
jgi:DNA-binding phage protein